jgi:hypothetical protein
MGAAERIVMIVALLAASVNLAALLIWMERRLLGLWAGPLRT